MHKRTKHRISQVGGINDAVKETEIVTLQLNALDCNEDEGTEKVKAEETFSLKMGKD